MFDNNFKEAEQYLRYAFEKCDRDSKVNKRLILIYLIPGKHCICVQLVIDFFGFSQDVAGTNAQRESPEEI